MVANFTITVLQRPDVVCVSEESLARAQFLALLLTGLRTNTTTAQLKVIASAIMDWVTEACARRRDKPTEHKQTLNAMDDYSIGVLDDNENLAIGQPERAGWVKEWATKVRPGSSKLRDGHKKRL